MVAVVLALLLQAPAPQPAPPVQLPVSLDRVRQGLSRPSRFEPRPTPPFARIFRVDIEAWEPFTEKAWVEPFAPAGWIRASAPRTHIDFLESVTPEEVRASTVYPCCNVVPVVEAVAGLVKGRIRTVKESRARKEVAEAMRAAGIRR